MHRFLQILSLSHCHQGTTSDPKEIIKELRVRPNLRSLSLNHSGLGDELSKVLFQWLAYGDNDSDIYDDKENCLSLPLPLLTNISLTGASIGNKGFGALVEWLERLKKRQQANISNPPSKIPDGIRELSLNSVRFLYFAVFVFVLIYSYPIPELYQWDIRSSPFVRISAFVS